MIAIGTKIARAMAPLLRPSMHKSRIPSMRCEIGLKSAMCLYTPLMVWRGKKALEKKSMMNTRGKIPCTASDEPVFSAAAAMKPLIAIAMSPPLTTMTRTPSGPPLILMPKGNNSKEKKSVWKAPYAAAPASRPTRMPSRDDGAAISL